VITLDGLGAACSCGREQRLDRVGRERVVVVEVEEPAALGQAVALVPRERRRREPVAVFVRVDVALRRVRPPQPRVAGLADDRLGLRVRAVSDHEHLEPLVGLVEHRRQRPRAQQLRSSERRDDHRDQRVRVVPREPVVVGCARRR